MYKMNRMKSVSNALPPPILKTTIYNILLFYHLSATVLSEMGQYRWASPPGAYPYGVEVAHVATSIPGAAFFVDIGKPHLNENIPKATSVSKKISNFAPRKPIDC